MDILQAQTDSHQARVVYDAKANKIVQLNRYAQEQGIRLGMGLASAGLLCCDLHVHEYKIEIEEKALLQLANQLYLVTSDIALDIPYGMYLRAQNMLNLYGGLPSYWQILKQVINRVGYTAHYASAYSVNVAKLLAVHQIDNITEDKQLVQRQLETCQLSKTDIDIKDLEKLQRIGVSTIKTLFSQPLSALASRVSRFSINVISELRGEAPAKLSFYYPAETYHDYIELLYDIELVARILPIIDSLLKRFEQYLLVRNALTLSIKLTLHLREHDAVEHIVNSALPIYKTDDWRVIIALQFEQLRFPSAIYAITLTCPKLEKADIAHSDFFAHKNTHVASLTLLSRLRAKLGERQVRLLQFRADFRPEFCSLSIVQNTQKESRKLSDAKHKYSEQKVYLDRPGFLLPAPELLAEKITIINGPERIVSGWWDTTNIQRDYFVAQNQQGQQIWVYKTPEEKWYVHGYFI